MRRLIASTLVASLLAVVAAHPVAASVVNSYRTCTFIDNQKTLTFTTKMMWNGNTGFTMGLSYKLTGGTLSTTRYDLTVRRWLSPYWGTHTAVDAINDGNWHNVYYTSGYAIGFHRHWSGDVLPYDWWNEVTAAWQGGCDTYYWSEDINNGYVYE